MGRYKGGVARYRTCTVKNVDVMVRANDEAKILREIWIHHPRKVSKKNQKHTKGGAISPLYDWDSMEAWKT